MMRLFLILFFCLSLLLPKKIWAINDPLSVDNNKYGIHIIDENDLENASSLVNSSGGDWGYVTLVITQDDRNLDKWQKIFAKMRQLHLIPLIRLATSLDNDTWQIPKLEDVSSWADFLNSLDWVTENRYVIIFNEPNHAKEWGGKLAAKEYADIISSFSATLKNRSPDFFILPAGFDASAPNSSNTLDEQRYLKEMIAYKPEILTSIDGWTSHSYPNPAYVGNVYDTGRGTLQTYKWELKILKSLGLTKKLPVFITETGWPHQEGTPLNQNYIRAEKVAEYIELAANTVWIDSSIVAITPFLLNYQAFPFSNFSWQMPASPNRGEPFSDSFYPQFDTYRSLAKIAGKPIRQIIDPTPISVLGVTNPNLSIKNMLLTFIEYLQKLVYNRN